MNNIIEILKPQLDPNFPNESGMWVCPTTGLKVPRDPVENLRYRKDILKRAENDKGMQDELMTACSLSLPYWISSFVWTYHQFEVKDGMRVLATHAHVPFITWNCQNVVLEEFVKALGIVTDAKKKGNT